MFPHRCFGFILLAILAFTSCGGEDKPTQPTILVGAAGGSLLQANLLDPPILLRAELLFDGQVIASVSHATPTGGVTLSGNITASPGSHTLAFRVVEQSSSPNTYDTVGVTVIVGGNTMFFENRRQVLQTGEAITYAVPL